MKHFQPLPWALAVCFLLAASTIRAEVLVPAPGRVDCIPDAARGLLYISTGTNHNVLRYSLANGKFLAPFEIGGEPGAMDLSLDGTTLAVADSADEVVHLIDVATGADTPVRLPPGTDGDAGLQSVAFGADDSVLVAARGIHTLQLRRIEPVTHAVADVAEVPGQTRLAASGDRQQIGVAMSSGCRLYDVGSKTLSAIRFDATLGNDVALNANGSQFAIAGPSSSLVIANSPGSSDRYSHTIGSSAVGVVFHPHRPLAFAAYGSALQVAVVNTETRTLVRTILPAGPTVTVQSFAQWPLRLRLASDASQLFLPVPDGVRIIPLGTQPVALSRASTFGLDGEIAITFNGPVAPSTATNSASYTLEPTGAVTSVRIDPNNASTVLLQTTGAPQRVRVTGVEGLLGDKLPSDSVVDIQSHDGIANDRPLLATPVVNGTELHVEFPSTPGMTHRVEESQDLLHWTSLGDVTASSDRTRATLPLQSAPSRRFVRVLRY